MSWTLHRIDDRLIHGQVVVAWGQRLHPQRIEIVDDAVAASAWERELLSGSAPGIVVSVHSVEDAARTLLARGVELDVQDVPATRAQPLATLDPSSVPA